MICKTCAIAGDLVAETRNKSDTYHPLLGHEAPVSMRQMVSAVAQHFHKQCKGRDHCDCAHKIDFEGKTVRKESLGGGKKAGKSSGKDRKSSRKASR